MEFVFMILCDFLHYKKKIKNEKNAIQIPYYCCYYNTVSV